MILLPQLLIILLFALQLLGLEFATVITKIVTNHEHKVVANVPEKIRFACPMDFGFLQISPRPSTTIASTSYITVAVTPDVSMVFHQPLTRMLALPTLNYSDLLHTFFSTFPLQHIFLFRLFFPTRNIFWLLPTFTCIVFLLTIFLWAFSFLSTNPPPVFFQVISPLQSIFLLQITFPFRVFLSLFLYRVFCVPFYSCCRLIPSSQRFSPIHSCS